jgi:hypothetical protein
MAATVPAKRGSPGATKPSRSISSRLASTSSPSKLSTKLPRSGLQARSDTTAWIASARWRQRPARSARPRRSAIRASRSHAAQHITLEKVCTRARVRSSQMPASGWSWSFQAWLPTRSRRSKSRIPPGCISRSSKNDCVAASTTLP